MSVVVLWLAGFFFVLSLIFSIMQPHLISWLASLAIAILFVAVLLPKYQQEQQALRVGQVVTTAIVDIQHWTRKKGDTDEPRYEIITQWRHPDSLDVYTFRSKPFKVDPTQYLPKTVQVKVNMDNPKAYIMDTSFMPK